MYLRIDEHDGLFAIDDSKGVVKNEDSKGVVKNEDSKVNSNVSGNSNECTYAELLEFANEIKSKVNQRELVFILSKNMVGSLAGYVSFYENRDVSLILDCALPAEMLAALVAEYSPAYIYAPCEWECEVPGIFSEQISENAREQNLENAPQQVLGNALEQNSGNNSQQIPENNSQQISLEQILTFKNFKLLKTGLASPAMNEQLAFLMTTSGSTGSPKLVRHKYGNLEHNAEVIAEAFEWTAEEKGICHLPLHYTMGRSVADSIIHAGGCCVLTEGNIMFPGFWKFIAEKQATSFTGVPYSYEIALKVKFLKRQLPDLKVISVGGGKLSEENFKVLSDYAKENGKKFYSTYGATETSARMSYLPPELACDKTGSIGKPFRGGEFILTEDSELVFKGKNVTMGYAVSRADLEKGDEWTGTYRTGDIARKDADGCYYISGRISRFLKLFGTRVGLDESEKLIGRQFDTECACTGTDKLMQIFVTKSGIAEDVKSFIANKTALPKTAFEVNEIAEIPHKSSGKVDYLELSARHSQAGNARMNLQS